MLQRPLHALRWRSCALALSVSLALLPLAALASDTGDEAVDPLSGLQSELRVSGMTFVGTHGESGRLVLRAATARFQPDSNLAQLEDVEVEGVGSDERTSFDVRCERGELDVKSNDFLAEGDVHGSTGDGRRYRTPWVRYDHDRELLFTDAPVTMVDDSGTFRGDGFRYHVAERRFRLLGNVSVVQEP